jgi:hypothetical protein
VDFTCENSDLINSDLTRKHGDFTRKNDDLTRNSNDLITKNRDFTRKNGDVTRKNADLTCKHGLIHGNVIELNGCFSLENCSITRRYFYGQDKLGYVIITNGYQW